MDKLKKIRWRHQFQNLEKALSQLQRGLAIEYPSDIEQQGIIQCFEFTFELSWKTLRDYLKPQGVICQFPREVIKQAFQNQIISAGEFWLDMLGKRNLLAHTYDEDIAMKAYRLIKDHFAPQIEKFIHWLKEANGKEED